MVLTEELAWNEVAHPGRAWTVCSGTRPEVLPEPRKGLPPLLLPLDPVPSETWGRQSNRI